MNEEKVRLDWVSKFPRENDINGSAEGCSQFAHFEKISQNVRDKKYDQLMQRSRHRRQVEFSLCHFIAHAILRKAGIVVEGPLPFSRKPLSPLAYVAA